MSPSIIHKLLPGKWPLNAGYVVLLAIILSIAGYFYPMVIPLAALLYWVAALSNKHKINRRNQLQAMILSLLGFGFMFLSRFENESLDVSGALDGNISIVTMIASVSFLTMISRPVMNVEEKLPQGKRAIVNTFLSVHLFGSVINMSSLFIHADRMSANRALSKEQIIVLTRGFSGAAFWSPFFAAMAVAVSYIPNANLWTIMLFGLSLSVLGMMMTYVEVTNSLQRSTFHGYPLKIASLWMPFLLALIVFVVHAIFTQLSILLIISLSAPLLCLLVLLTRGDCLNTLKDHIENKLNNMHNEIVLFLSAGIFGYGLQKIIYLMPLQSLFQQFDALVASICFIVVMLLSVLGFHQLIGISIIAPLILPLNPDPLLFSLVILCSWSLGAAVGPLSGINISMQSGYGIDSNKILRWNLRYVSVMSMLVIAMFFGIEVWRV